MPVLAAVRQVGGTSSARLMSMLSAASTRMFENVTLLTTRRVVGLDGHGPPGLDDVDVVEGDAVHALAHALRSNLAAHGVVVDDDVLVSEVLRVDGAARVLVLRRHAVVARVEEGVGERAVRRLVEIDAVGLVVGRRPRSADS